MSELFLELFNRAMAAGWLVLAVMVLRLVLRKAPRWIFCLLWALVGLRLVWPFSLESAVSLLPSREVLSPEMLYAHAPAIHTGLEFVNSPVNQSFTPAMTAAPGASVNPLQIWTWLAGWGWCIGAAVLLGYALCSYLQQEMPIVPLCFKTRTILLQQNVAEGISSTINAPYSQLYRWIFRTEEETEAGQ